MQLVWDEFLKILREEAGSQIVETWFKAVCLEEWNADEKTVVLRVPNQFVSSWIQEHYLSLLKTHLGRLLHTTSLKFLFLSVQTQEGKRDIIPASPLTTKPFLDSQPIPSLSELPARMHHVVPSTGTMLEPTYKKFKKRPVGQLNEAYQFNSFVVGPSNSLAHAAAYAVSQGLGRVYNPLFIYGGTGLGKTHLMHAIGNEVKRRNPQSVVCYETADHFMNEFINSIRFDKSHQFREKYQRIDLLLVDDVQFFSNKEQTQETFFHIFNILYEQQKQIILSSDTFPKEITGLQSRLKSRMEWGLVVDIQTPDLETKIAILKKKADMHNINLNDEVADFIAGRVISNIRELEGSLIRIGAFSALTNQPVTLELAKRVLLHLNEKKKDGVMLDNVLKVVAQHYDISITDLKSKKRHKDVSSVRQVAFYMMKKLTFCSLQAIGEYVGGRDHSTVIHAIGKVETMIENDLLLNQKLKAIEHDIMTS